MEASTITVFSSPPASPPNLDAVSFGRLSANLDCLLDPAFFDCADAEITLAAGGDDQTAAAAVSVHRCILAARSSFFLNHFSSLPAATAGEKPRLELAELVPGGRHIRRDAVVAVLGYMYTGRLKLPPQEAIVCVDCDCTHDACRPAIDFIVESTYAASGFQISELASLFQVLQLRMIHQSCCILYSFQKDCNLFQKNWKYQFTCLLSFEE
jgi:regulatory protein NPR1